MFVDVLSCYLAGSNPVNEWLQFEFQVVRHVVGIKLRGRRNIPQYVREYQIQYWDVKTITWKSVLDDSDDIEVQ